MPVDNPRAERAGVRELKANLSRYIDRVRRGSTIDITAHGKVVGRIVPVSEDVHAQVSQLLEAGIIEWSGRRLPRSAAKIRPRKKVAVSDLVVEDRE